VAVFDLKGTERFRTNLREEVSNLAFSADGSVLAVTTGNSPVQLWDVASGKLQWTGTTDFGNTYGIRIGADSNLIVTADGDTHVRAYDRKGKLLYAEGGGLLEPFDVSLPTDGKTFIVAGAEGTMELHESATGKMLKKSASLGNPIFLVAIAPQGRKAIGLALDAHTLHPAAIPFWNLDSGELQNLQLDPKTLLGMGQGANNLLLVRQESPQQIIVESVE
jgi:tricorn protease-like protein